MAAPVDYFVSYTSPDKTWAEWIGWVLEEAGATVRLQAWDFVPGSNFVLEMQRAAGQARRTIAVLSPDYLKSRFAAPEWASAFAQDPEGLSRRLVPVRVRDCTLEGILQTIVYIDLVGLDEFSARKRLSDGLESKRGKPDSAPPFPGAVSNEHAADDQKAFPGAKQPVPPASSSGRPSSYLPKIRGAISDLDRTRFIKGAFETIRQHFEASLRALAAEPSVDTELTCRSDTDFVAEVFVNGSRKTRCRVWLGGMMGGGNEISYYEGNQDISNAVNEALTIAHGQDNLALNAMMNMGIGMNRLPPEIDPRCMSPEHASEYLWHRFLWRLQ
jgi:hypothetical protein